MKLPLYYKIEEIHSIKNKIKPNMNFTYRYRFLSWYVTYMTIWLYKKTSNGLISN